MEQLSSSSSKTHNISSNSSSFFNAPDIDILELARSSRQLKYFVISDDYIEGEITKTQLYLEQLHTKGNQLFKETFVSVWVELYASDNPKYLYTFISIASCIPYEWLEHHGDALILGCCAHESELVNEACIRLSESWENKSHAAQLEKMKSFECDWLEEYRLETIEYLKELD